MCVIAPTRLTRMQIKNNNNFMPTNFVFLHTRATSLIICADSVRYVGTVRVYLDFSVNGDVNAISWAEKQNMYLWLSWVKCCGMLKYEKKKINNFFGWIIQAQAAEIYGHFQVHHVVLKLFSRRRYSLTRWTDTIFFNFRFLALKK